MAHIEFNGILAVIMAVAFVLAFVFLALALLCNMNYEEQIKSLQKKNAGLKRENEFLTNSIKIMERKSKGDKK